MRLALVLVCVVGCSSREYTLRIHRDCPNAMVAYAQAAATAWSQAADVRIDIEMTDQRVVRGWHTMLLMPATLDGPIVGHTRLVRPWMNAQIWIDWDRVAARNIAAAALTHEIGHALGIRGHSSDPNDVMFPFVGPSIPTPRDVHAYQSGACDP